MRTLTIDLNATATAQDWATLVDNMQATGRLNTEEESLAFLQRIINHSIEYGAHCADPQATVVFTQALE